LKNGDTGQETELRMTGLTNEKRKTDYVGYNSSC